MDRLDRSTLIGMLNDDKVYGADLNLFLQFRLLSNKNNEGFKKEDNDIWYYVNTNQNSTCFVDKLRLFFRTIPNADYIYYFNNKDCLLSKIIEDKQFNVVYSLIKEKESYHKNLISNPNKNNENILHVLLKNVNSADEFMDILNLMLDLIRISENKEDLILKKDKNEKTFMDYFIDNMKNYYQDYEQIQISGYNLSAKIFSDSKEIFAKTNTDYIKELLPYFKWPIDINEDPYELENTFLEIKTIQEKRKIWQSLNAHQSINNCKKRLWFILEINYNKIYKNTGENPNYFGENVVLVTLKNINSDMDLFEYLHMVSDLMRKTDNKDEMWIQKDNKNKDSIDYLFMNIKEDYGILNAYIFKMIADLMGDVEQIFEQKNGFKFPNIKPFTSESVIQEEVINVSKNVC